MKRIIQMGKESGGKVSSREWPIRGGTNLKPAPKESDTSTVLLTGHEDGSIRVWSLNGRNGFRDRV